MALDYERLTVRDLKRIVNRGEASPAEIGLYVMYATLERERGHKSIVTNELLRWIEGKWVTKPYANELDYWIDLGKHVRRMEFMAAQDLLIVYVHSLQVLLATGFAEGRVYGYAYKGLYPRARELGLSVPSLTDEQAAALAAQIPDVVGYPTELLRTEWDNALVGLGEQKAIWAVLHELSRFLGVPLIDTGIADVEAGLNQARIALERLRPYSPELEEAVAGLRDYTAVEPDERKGEQYTAIATRYLPGEWREWAQAGISLQEAAIGANGILDAVYAIVNRLPTPTAGVAIGEHIYVPFEQEEGGHE